MYNKQLSNLREKLNRRILRPLNKQQKFNFHFNLVHKTKKLPTITTLSRALKLYLKTTIP